MTAQISICIPTYNRAPLLAQLLDSIAREASPDLVEIAISDNASTDDTETIVRAFAAKWPSLVYERQERNFGPDRNYLKCVEISSAPYCWLMGSDDCVAPGAVVGLLESIGKHKCDLYLGARQNCSFEMAPQEVEPWLSIEQPRYFDFGKEHEFVEYMQRALTLGAVFSYLSSIVVKRAGWNAFRIQDRYIGSAYSHAYLLLQVANSSGIFYLPQPLVWNRTGNDFFAKDGEARRILLDLDGYLMLADDLYPSPGPRRTAFLGLLRRAHRPLRTLVALRSRLTDTEWGSTAVTLRRCGYSSPLLSMVTPLRAPLRAALGLKHALRAARR